MDTRTAFLARALVLLAAACPCGADPGSPILYPVREHDRLGFIDRGGKLVCPAQFDEVGSFSEGLVAVRRGELWGFVDVHGRMICPAQFAGVRSFREGLAAVRLGGTWGFVDTRGRLVCPALFDVVLDLTDGMAAVLRGQFWGFVDAGGRLAIEPRFVQVREFSTGRAAVLEQWDRVEAIAGLGSRMRERWGFIDRAGAWVVPPRYPLVEDFSEGMALVHDGLRCGFVDLAGGVVIPLRFEAAGRFQAGRTLVQEDGCWRTIDSAGRTVTEAAPEVRRGWAARPRRPAKLDERVDHSQGQMVFLSDGRARVRGRDWRLGYVDASGRLVIPCRFSCASDFTGGFARVKIDGRYEDGMDWWVGGRDAIIDRQGRVVAEVESARGNGIWGPTEGLVGLMRDGFAGYVSLGGEVVVPLQYVEAGEFHGGLARVVRRRPDGTLQERYIDPTGAVVWEGRPTRDLPGSPARGAPPLAASW